MRLKARGASKEYRGSVEGVRSVREGSEQRGHERGGLGERNGDGELGFDQNVKQGRGEVYLRPRYRQVNVLRKLAASTALSGRRIWGGLSSVHERKGEKGSSAASFIGRDGALRGRTLVRLSPASRRLDGRLMASINWSLKVGGE